MQTENFRIWENFNFFFVQINIFYFFFIFLFYRQLVIMNCSIIVNTAQQWTMFCIHVISLIKQPPLHSQHHLLLLFEASLIRKKTIQAAQGLQAVAIPQTPTTKKM